MTLALVTVTAPVAVGRLSDALAAITTLGNPARDDVALALGRPDGEDGIHFASLHAIPPTDEDSPSGHIVLEFSADGSEPEALKRLVDRVGPALRTVFSMASDWIGGDLLAYLTDRRLELGFGWSGRTGLAFAGTPGMSVGRIRREAELAKGLAAGLEDQGDGWSALQRLAAIRDRVRANPSQQWALQTPESLPPAPNAGLFSVILSLAVSFAKIFLWPLAVVAVAIGALAYLAVQIMTAAHNVQVTNNAGS
jgi:hypothetical protein